MIYGMCQRSILWFLRFNIHTSRHERMRVAQLCGRMFSGVQFSKGKVPLCEELKGSVGHWFCINLEEEEEGGKNPLSVTNTKEDMAQTWWDSLSFSFVCKFADVSPQMKKKKKKKSPRKVAVIRRSLLSGSPKKAQTKSGSAAVWWVVEIKAKRLEYRQHRISYRMISFNSL